MANGESTEAIRLLELKQNVNHSERWGQSKQKELGTSWWVQMMLRRPCWICGYGGIKQASSDGMYDLHNSQMYNEQFPQQPTFAKTPSCQSKLQFS